MTRALLIVNPAAGGGTAPADVEALLDVLRDGFGTIDLLEDRPRAPDRSRAGGAGGPRGLRRRARCRRRWHGRPGGTRSRWQEGRARRPAVRHVHEHRAIDVGQVGETLFFEAAGIGMDGGRVHGRPRDPAWRPRVRHGGARRAPAPARRARSHRCRWSRHAPDPAGRGQQRSVARVGLRGRAGRAGRRRRARPRRVRRQQAASAARDDRPGIDRDRPARGRRYRGVRITLSATREPAVHADGVVVGDLPQTFTARPKALKMYAPCKKR